MLSLNFKIKAKTEVTEEMVLMEGREKMLT